MLFRSSESLEIEIERDWQETSQGKAKPRELLQRKQYQLSHFRNISLYFSYAMSKLSDMLFTTLITALKSYL